MRNLPYLLVATLVLLLSVHCQSSEISIQVFDDVSVADSRSFTDGYVKASAKRLEFHRNTSRWKLVGDCAVTIERYPQRPVRLKGDKIHIVADDVEWQIYSNHMTPTKDLSDFLKSHPQISWVRLGWGSNMGGYGSSSTALYNRKTKSFKEYTVSGDSATGMSYISSTLYDNVTNEMIDKATQDANNRKADAGEFSLNILEEYGATRKELR